MLEIEKELLIELKKADTILNTNNYIDLYIDAAKIIETGALFNNQRLIGQKVNQSTINIMKETVHLIKRKMHYELTRSYFPEQICANILYGYLTDEKLSEKNIRFLKEAANFNTRFSKMEKENSDYKLRETSDYVNDYIKLHNFYYDMEDEVYHQYIDEIFVKIKSAVEYNNFRLAPIMKEFYMNKKNRSK